MTHRLRSNRTSVHITNLDTAYARAHNVKLCATCARKARLAPAATLEDGARHA